MGRASRIIWSVVTGSAIAAAVIVPAGAQVAEPPVGGMVAFAASAPDELRTWDATVTALSRDGGLRLRGERADAMIDGRSHERFDQSHKGVRVYGGDVARQSAGGLTVSIFGTVYGGIDLDTTPAFGADEAKARVEALAGVPLGDSRLPELVVLPMAGGGYRLAYLGRALSMEGLFLYFVDATTGELIARRDDLKRQAAKGTGHGVLGDPKKLSVARSGSMYRATDMLRPPEIHSFDMRGNVNRTISFLNGATALTVTDLASDSDNDWSDGAAVDAHAYAGWVYDYYFKRFNRRGLDNQNKRIISLVHPANRADLLRYPGSIIGLFYLNAAYFGDGVMVYGEGLPAEYVDSDGRAWNYTAGALDIVAHELTHGVTDYTSRLIYENEPGALNEAISDILAVGAEFHHQPAGNGPQQADYLMGEDVITPGGLRSLADPASKGDPDHYSRRYTGKEDNGGVHINSTIPSHAFYLAVEGGVNRTSGQGVAGVGRANMEQMERAFYRAFMELLPSNASFSMARTATVQAARDLYGAGSAVESALHQAWTAVGVH
jgi:Zn-dependent metalloprotease